MQNNTNYDASSVKVLKGLDGVRQSPGMYIGSVDQKGLHHCVKEQISNGVDEYLNGSCTDIWITLHKDGSTTVRDNGRGIPHGLKEDGLSVLSTCFGVLHAGGKFDNAGNSGYNTSGGEHGIGAKACSALSKRLVVTSCRDGLKDTSIFEKGILIEQITNESVDKNLHGVEVHWAPDMDIFTDNFNSELLEKELVREFSYLNSGLHFHFEDESKNYKKDYYSENGMRDYLEYLNNNKEFLFNPIYLTSSEDKFSIDIAIAYNSSYSSTLRLYTNSIPQEKGTHLTGFKTAWTMAINSFAKENKWLKENDANLAGTDLEEGMMLIINFKMIDPMFEGQNKSNLTSSEGRTYTQRLVSNVIKDYLIQNKSGIKILVDKALNARKAREAAKKAREAVRKPKEKGLKAKMALSDKFIDCTSKNSADRNLLLVEGKSASTSAIEARNPATDCIYMLRGKTISPLKTTVDKILANQEMSDIIKVIGAGFGNENFDLSKMNFDKIVITSDQDADGFAIELLLITFFYTYMRPLVEAGKLYRAVTPLYIVRQKDKEYYCYTEKELEDWKLAHTGTYDLLRAKGLGELNATDLRKVCFEQERYKRITVSDAKATTNLLEVLQGRAVEPRKKYIYDNAKELGFNFI